MRTGEELLTLKLEPKGERKPGQQNWVLMLVQKKPGEAVNGCPSASAWTARRSRRHWRRPATGITAVGQR